MTPEHIKTYFAEEAGVAHRFAPGVDLQGGWEGLKISNYQLAGEHAASRIIETVGDQPILEVCTGIGATTFVLAQTSPKVYAVDLNPTRLQIAREDIERMGLEDKVEFLQGDILDDKLLEKLTEQGIAAVYTDVDWTATGDWQEHVTDITQTGPSTQELHRLVSSHITPNISMKLPKTINLEQIQELADCEIESVKPDGKLSFYLVYFGDLIEQDESEFVFDKFHYQESNLT